MQASDRPHLPGAALIVVLSLLAALTACRSAPTTDEIVTAPWPTTGRSFEPYRLASNDIVLVNVFGHPELSTPITANVTGSRIDSEGYLGLPLIEAVCVAGLTVREARSEITEALLEYMIEPKVTFSVVEFGGRFTIHGEIRSPGAFTIDRSLTALEAIALGGGFTPYADRAEIILLRYGDRGVDFFIINGEYPDASGLVTVRSQDVLFVRRTGLGRFSEDTLPILSAVSSSLGSLATVLLIQDQLED
jgi:polysaccharide biosynthesis/export protein